MKNLNKVAQTTEMENSNREIRKLEDYFTWQDYFTIIKLAQHPIRTHYRERKERKGND